jgi:hypothetical protein
MLSNLKLWLPALAFYAAGAIVPVITIVLLSQ